MKAKGISQNGYTEKILGLDLQPTGDTLSRETFRYLLERRGAKQQIVNPSYLKKNSKDCTIRSVVMPKTIPLVSVKRILRDNYTTSPYGTKL